MFKKNMLVVILSLLICMVAISSVSAADDMADDNLTADSTAIEDDISADSSNENTVNIVDDDVGGGDNEIADPARDVTANEDSKFEISQNNADGVSTDSPTHDSYNVAVENVTVNVGDEINIPINITPNSNTEYKYDFYINIYDEDGDNIFESDRIYDTVGNTFYNYCNDELDWLDSGVYKVVVNNYNDNEEMCTSKLIVLDYSINITINKTGTSYDDIVLTFKAFDSNTNKVMSDLEIYIEFSDGDYDTLITNSEGIATYNVSSGPGDYTVEVVGIYHDLFDFDSSNFISSNFSFNVPKNKGKMSISQSGKYYGDKKIIVALTDLVTNAPVGNQLVKILFSNGKSLFERTNSKGVATFNVGLNPGKYAAKVVVSSDFVEFATQEISSVSIVKAPVQIKSKNLKTTYNSGKYFTVKVVNKNTGKAIKGVKIKVIVKGGKTATKTTDADGKIKISTSKLGIGTHKVTVKILSKNLVDGKTKTNKIIVKKSGLKISAPNALKAYNQNEQYQVRVTNKASGDPVKGIKVTMKVFTGKKYKKYTLRTNSNGYVSFSTKSLSKAKHKVTVSIKANKYYKSAKSKGSVKMVNKLKTIIECGQPRYTVITLFSHGVAYSRVVTGASFIVHIYDSKGKEIFKKIKITNSDGSIKTDTSGNTVFVSPGSITIKFAGDNKYMSCKKTLTI